MLMGVYKPWAYIRSLTVYELYRKKSWDIGVFLANQLENDDIPGNEESVVCC